MPRKLDGTYIQTGSITTTQLSSAVTTQISAGGGPRVTSLSYPGNDTAANTVGGQTVYIIGSGFDTNNAVYINGNAVPSKSFISASNVSFTTPALSAGIYPVYFINTDTGATAIFVPGLSISAEPAWVTSAGSLSGSQDEGSAWSYSLSATGDAPITYALAAGSSLPTGVSLASNGVISGTISSPTGNVTTYTFSVVATDAQNQDSTRQFTVTTSTGEGVLFANNVLLIHADGTNNQNNHTFLDSSNNNFTITRYGNATQGSFSPFSQTGWSYYFDGSGDYLTTPSSGQFAPTGDFTISMWFYPTSFAASYYVLAGSWSAGASDEWLIQYDNTGAIRFLTTTDSTFSSAGVVKLNQWNFLSVSRSGNTVTGYVNGSSFRSYTLTGTVGSASKSIYIGIQANGSSWPYLGYISNLRLVSGSAQSATPPTSASTAISGTSLLTCQSNRFVDNSTNAFTLTRNGDVSVQAFSPFAPTAAYSTANVGGSLYLDGSGDYLSFGRISGLNLGNSDWTFEFWTYATSSFGAMGMVLGSLLYDNGFGSYGFFFDTTNFRTYIRYNGGTLLEINTAISSSMQKTWSHIAVTRSGSNIRVFLNGVQQGATNTTIGSSSIDAAYAVEGYETPYAIGATQSRGSINGYYPGYIADLRLIKGNALYTSNFTPPTAPPTNIANTTLLCNFTNAGIYDHTAKTVMETVGETKISTSVYKYGTGSISYDGSGDYILVKPTPDLEFGSGDFTIEFWWYPTSTSRQGLYHGSFGTDWSVGIDYGAAAGKIGIWASSTGSSWNLITADNSQGQGTTTVSQNAWNHIAFVRSGTTWMLFVNGNRDLNLTGISGTIVNRASSQKAIGCWWSTGAMAQASGYMDDFRITKGYARYTSNFTPPSSAFKDK